MTEQGQASASDDVGIDLYWIPLGAGASVVKLNGKAYEAIKAFIEHRSRTALYHSALEIRAPEGRYGVEVTPVPDRHGDDRGAVAVGPVGMRWLGWFRLFRYEIRRWLDGTIPDVGLAVESPVRVADDLATAESARSVALSAHARMGTRRGEDRRYVELELRDLVGPRANRRERGAYPPTFGRPSTRLGSRHRGCKAGAGLGSPVGHRLVPTRSFRLCSPSGRSLKRPRAHLRRTLHVPLLALGWHLYTVEHELGVQHDVRDDRREDVPGEEERQRLRSAREQRAEHHRSRRCPPERGVTEVVDEDRQQRSGDRQTSSSDRDPTATRPASISGGLPDRENRERREEDRLGRAVDEPLPCERPHQSGSHRMRL
jgi:hypothetical protein